MANPKPWQPPPERRFQHPALFLCDIQESFRDAIFEFDKIVATARKLIVFAQTLQIPVYVTTQNEARLGSTVRALSDLLDSNLEPGPGPVYEDKTRFSMWIPAIASQFAPGVSAEIAIVGIESHICVTQTALDLLRAGHRVYVIADGVSSAHREEVGIALARLRSEGATVTTSESWMYECMGDAGVKEFKKVVGLVKDEKEKTKDSLRALLGKM